MENILKSSGLVLVDAVNYNRWQYDQLRPHVGKKVLEIGCGLGNLTQYLREDAEFLFSTDTRPEAVEFMRERCPATEEFEVRCADIFNETSVLPHPPFFDTIVFSNVLEHIEDDVKAMKMCADILRPTQGKLLLLVPAHPFLYGTLDAESGHYRRYSKKEIIRLAGLAHFKIIDLYAFNMTGALGWFLNYCVLRRKGSHNSTQDTQVSFFDRYCVRPCRFIEEKIRPPVGISYIAIMQAKEF